MDGDDKMVHHLMMDGDYKMVHHLRCASSIFGGGGFSSNRQKFLSVENTLEMAWGGFLDGFLKKLMVDTGGVGQISMDDLFVACSAC